MQTSATTVNPSNSTGSKATRKRFVACYNCRAAHKKCSEERPCKTCVSMGLNCYDAPTNAASKKMASVNSNMTTYSTTLQQQQQQKYPATGDTSSTSTTVQYQFDYNQPPSSLYHHQQYHQYVGDTTTRDRFENLQQQTPPSIYHQHHHHYHQQTAPLIQSRSVTPPSILSITPPPILQQQVSPQPIQYTGVNQYQQLQQQQTILEDRTKHFSPVANMYPHAPLESIQIHHPTTSNRVHHEKLPPFSEGFGNIIASLDEENIRHNS
jgi:hypothetical protein